jgi:hypothetical protein
VAGQPAPSTLEREDQLRMWAVSSSLVGLPPDTPPPRSEPPGFGTWAMALVTGEMLGFGATALVAWIGIRLAGAPETAVGHGVAAGVMAFAGVLEGASLGWFQWRALRGFLPRLRAGEWMRPTVLLAAGGWLVGMAIPAFMQASQPGGWAPAEGPGAMATVLFSALFGLGIGALFGAAQWVVLRRHAERAGRWIAGNAAGWALGLPATYVAGGLVDEGSSTVVVMLVATCAAALMGLGVSLATWVSLRGMRARDLP